MPSMTGTFKLIKSDNFGEYLKSIRVRYVMLNKLTSATPIVVISTDGDEWTIKTCTPHKDNEIKFKLGQQFEENTIDGRTCKSIINQEGDDKLVHVQQYPDTALTAVIVREFTDTQMKVTLVVPTGTSPSSTRIFQRQ